MLKLCAAVAAASPEGDDFQELSENSEEDEGGREKKTRGHAVSRRGKSRIYRNTFQASRPASRRRSMRDDDNRRIAAVKL